MNDRNHSSFALSNAADNAAKHSSSTVIPNVFLPTQVYEALPAAYVFAGSLLVLGAAYVGVGYPPMIGYLAAGLSCIAAGFAIAGVRRTKRAKR